MNVSSALVPGLARYVPRHVLAAVAGGAAMHNVPVARGFEGVALMLDIAGFSTLTEDFAHEGAAGAERLSAVLDAYFGRMTAIALMHGGDVVDFVGDAMLVVWETGGGTDLRYTATLAAQCGLAMQHALPEITARTAVDLRQRTKTLFD